ncbi:MAG TPA: hypothetical protein VHF46_05980 [Rubrobacteraceae bacterium]|nr:hypothetical protein [Rubrobacteraceae bacterium]
MSECSLSPLKYVRFRLRFRAFWPPPLKETLGYLYRRARGDSGSVQATATLESRAVGALREYLNAHAASLERAARLEEKAERLEKAGTPSESVRNRAERARAEVVTGLAVLRASFVATAGGREGACAFDRVVEQWCPGFMLPWIGGHTP